MLFKADERGTGEDWAEKIACELCGLLGLPHVHYDLAVATNWNRPGVICASCAPPPKALILGNQLLIARDPTYPAQAGLRYKVREHTVAAVAEVTRRLHLPSEPWRGELPAGIDTAVDVFTGYLMLDAWIANQDRHHENWGALRVGNDLHLAPTFDHGASLARNLTDLERADRLVTRDKSRQIAAFARRARSALYGQSTSSKPLTTFEAWEAFARETPPAAIIWRDRLQVIDESAIRQQLNNVPLNRLSETGREFNLRLLMENRQRILIGE